jgi:ligand-binding sensor domain-containing protein
VATNTDAIYEFDRKTDTFREIQYKSVYLGNNNQKYMQEDKSGLIYITSEFSAVHVYNPVTGESRLIDRTENALNALSVKTRILPMGPDEIWIGTDGGGINIYNPLTGAMQYLMVDTRNNYSLSGNAIFKIYQDRDRNIWVGHFGSGISVWKRTRRNSPRIHTVHSILPPLIKKLYVKYSRIPRDVSGLARMAVD